MKANSTTSQAVAVGFSLTLSMAFSSAAIILAGLFGFILIAFAMLLSICLCQEFADPKNSQVTRNVPVWVQIGLSTSMLWFMFTGPASAPFVLGVATLILLGYFMWYAVGNPKSVARTVEIIGATVVIGLTLLGSAGVAVVYALCLLDPSTSRDRAGRQA